MCLGFYIYLSICMFAIMYSDLEFCLKICTYLQTTVESIPDCARLHEVVLNLYKNLFTLTLTLEKTVSLKM